MEAILILYLCSRNSRERIIFEEQKKVNQGKEVN